MTHRILRVFFINLTMLLSGCGPVKTTNIREYTLEKFSQKKYRAHPINKSILVSPPEASSAYQTEQMQYTVKPYTLNSFSKNAWASPPANLIYPLLIQSLQASNFFKAVTSGAYADQSDYRLDTQIIAIKQNFLVTPSELQLIARVSLSDVVQNKAIATQKIIEKVRCPYNSPYGGVIAANQAAEALTQDSTRFVINHIKRHV